MVALLRSLPLLLLACPGSAVAFSLADHRALSERALALETGAHPSLAACADILPRAAVREDLDLLTKWGRFSHYYNPEGPLVVGWREASDARVRALWAAVQEALSTPDPGHLSPRACRLAGRLLHQVQDMGSPPHVVPVAHGLGDGFESFELAGIIATATGEGPLPQADVVALHHALAVDTRAAVLGGPTDAQGPWTAYWRPDQAGGFGHYGRGRRDYGRGQGPWGGAFEAFAQDRVEATLCASRAFLRLLAQEIGRSSVE